MKNLKVILILILLGVAALMLLKQYADEEQINSGSNFTVNNSITIDSCRNYTGTEKAQCYVEGNLSNLNVSLEICRGLKQKFTNNDAMCMAKISSVVSRENPEIALSICYKIDDTPSDADRTVSMRCYENVVPYFSSDLDRVKEICGKSFYPHICYAVAARVQFYKNLTKALYFCNMSGDMCFKGLAKISNNSTQAIDFCNNVSVDYGDRYACFSTVVYNAMLRDEDEAEKIAEELNCCRSEIAFVLSSRKDKRAIEICQKHNSYECFLTILPNLGGLDKNFALSYCDNISWDVDRDICYFNIVKSIADSDMEYALNICSKTKFRDDCYRVTAVSIQNKTNAVKICNSIGNDYYKDLCYKEINLIKQ
ncbi:MAG: hypothetical protein QMD06_00155 [Candidatus Altarchaeum sp.]|nr:hypothetical protein [Candidatus Altarchaeum sp.]